MMTTKFGRTHVMDAAKGHVEILRVFEFCFEDNVADFHPEGEKPLQSITAADTLKIDQWCAVGFPAESTADMTGAVVHIENFYHLAHPLDEITRSVEPSRYFYLITIIPFF